MTIFDRIFPTPPRRLLAAIVGMVLILQAVTAAHAIAEDKMRNLSDGRQAVIHITSSTVLLIGRLATQAQDDRVPTSTYDPIGIDNWIRRVVHGDADTVSNFLDNAFGSVITPVASLAAIGLMDINSREFSRDIPFFISGLAATKGITALSKTLVARPRPYCLDGGCPPPDLLSDDPYHRRSFISGHTSAAFYSATFFNSRLRRYMRRHWTGDEYRIGRWVSPALSFGWAGLVGLSRIHADKHYFTDVLAGAIVGTAVSEIYYHLAYKHVRPSGDGETAGSRAVQFSWGFRF